MGGGRQVQGLLHLQPHCLPGHLGSMGTVSMAVTRMSLSSPPKPLWAEAHANQDTGWQTQHLLLPFNSQQHGKVSVHRETQGCEQPFYFLFLNDQI